jgi:hypothetical protein
MTPADRGLAALVDALHMAGFGKPRSRRQVIADFGEREAAAILADRAVFLPDGDCGHEANLRAAYEIETSEGTSSNNAALRAALMERESTIAALRAALDEKAMRGRVGAVIDRWYHLGLIRFNSRDDGGDDLILRDEIVLTVLAAPEKKP